MIWSKPKSAWKNVSPLNRTTALRKWRQEHFLSPSVLFRLILNAVLNAILEHNDAADLFFEAVTSEDGENVVGWTLYGKQRRSTGTFLLTPACLI